MREARNEARIDKASRVILASARTLYRAFLDAEMMANWRAPEAMTAQVSDFRPQAGGGYRMVLHYDDQRNEAFGKSGPGKDAVEVRFAQMLPEEKIVEEVRFVSDDPAFAGVMTLVTTFEKDRDGTRVTFSAHDVPEGISAADHALGMAQSLLNLARLTE